MKKTVSLLIVLLLAVSLAFANGTKEEIVSVDTNEPTHLTMAVVSSASILDYNTNNFSKWLEETANVDLEFIVIQSDVATEKMNLMLNSGDYPDIWMNIVPSETMYGIENDVLVELTPYINSKIMPNLTKAFEEFPLLASGSKAMDGKIYTFCNMASETHTAYYNKMWYNSMELEKTGMDVPTNIDEFYAVLKKYKEVNPSGVPLTGEVTALLGFITNMFTYYPNSEYGLRLNPEGKVETMIDTEGYRQALIFMNKLYKEGLLYEATFNMDDSQRKALITSAGEPVLFMAQKHNARFIDGNATPELYAHTKGLAPLAGPDGTRYTTYFIPGVSAKAAISTTCKNIEKACEVIDLFYSGEGMLRNYWGTPGVDWRLANPGETDISGNQAYYVRLNAYSNEASDRSWVTQGIYYTPKWGSNAAEVDGDLTLASNGSVLRHVVTFELYAPVYQTKFQTIPKLKFTTEETEEISFLGTSLKSYINQSTVEFISGTLNLDKDWDTYAKAITKMGMNDLIKIYQTALTR